MDTPMEIERKWIVGGWPEAGLPLVKEESMRQGYVSVRPTVRIREEQPQGEEPSYILCLKSKGKLARKEIEIPVPEETFRNLEDLIGLPLVPKLRRTYLLPDGNRLEVNQVEPESDTGFWYAEVEFASVEDAESWEIPEPLRGYLSREVTQEKGYSMGAYWEKTRM